MPTILSRRREQEPERMDIRILEDGRFPEMEPGITLGTPDDGALILIYPPPEGGVGHSVHVVTNKSVYSPELKLARIGKSTRGNAKKLLNGVQAEWVTEKDLRAQS